MSEEKELKKAPMKAPKVSQKGVENKNQAKQPHGLN